MDCKTFSPVNQIARIKQNGEALELLKHDILFKFGFYSVWSLQSLLL